MVTRTLPCAVMRKLARLAAGNGAEAGYHACGSLRVTVQPPAPPVLLGRQVLGVGLDEQLFEHRVHDGPPGSAA
jgi:hypothetical protein